ncbi:uncharacterized protein LOC131955227 [Physella acuta]|uniref:uncharacterized protein LOC131955227 n=1 Tax=Physella acuta TaxID=109671 RepID=UPI0027DE20BA|nr:uncharacterized protein LOC131955227 [Physella acuta]
MPKTTLALGPCPQSVPTVPHLYSQPVHPTLPYSQPVPQPVPPACTPNPCLTPARASARTPSQYPQPLPPAPTFSPYPQPVPPTRTPARALSRTLTCTPSPYPQPVPPETKDESSGVVIHNMIGGIKINLYSIIKALDQIGLNYIEDLLT